MQCLAKLTYALRLLLFRQKLPCFLGMVVTDRCNLDCFYCESKNKGLYHFSFAQAHQALREAHARGHRFLYFTGGEPMLWRDGEHTLRDLALLARQIGFWNVFVYTNGTLPLNIPEVSYIVTVDGPRHVHDQIRPGTYDIIMRNVAAAATRHVIASITFCKANLPYLAEFVKEITALRLFRGISFNLLTHCPTILQQHGLSDQQRPQALDELWRLKKQGYPIALSRAAYLAMRNNTWKRPVRQVELLTDKRLFTCCRDIDNPDVCRQCGYAGCVEIAQILALRPSAIWQGIKMSRPSRPCPRPIPQSLPSPPQKPPPTQRILPDST